MAKDATRVPVQPKRAEKAGGNAPEKSKVRVDEQKPRPSYAVVIDRIAAVAATILALAMLYRWFLWDLAIIALPQGREVQPIEDFPYDCVKVEHPMLEACEDMWLDHSSRKLYAACATVEGRKGWNPAIAYLDPAARSGQDHIAVIDIDKPGANGLYGLRKLKLGNYDGTLDLHSLDVKEVNGHLRFWLVNHKPPVNETTGELLDALALGANSTVEVFDLNAKTETLNHFKTIHSHGIIAPNNLAVSEDGNGFYFTNDHDSKRGLTRHLTGLVGTGSISYCNTESGECYASSKGKLHHPNGILLASDGNYYVANSARGSINVFRNINGSFTAFATLTTNYGIDNLSLDEDGNIIAAAFSKVLDSVKAIKNPDNGPAASAVLRILKFPPVQPDGPPFFKVEKMIEDRDAKFLPTATVAIHDSKTGRLFISGPVSQFVTVCSKRAEK